MSDQSTTGAENLSLIPCAHSISGQQTQITHAQKKKKLLRVFTTSTNKHVTQESCKSEAIHWPPLCKCTNRALTHSAKEIRQEEPRYHCPMLIFAELFNNNGLDSNPSRPGNYSIRKILHSSTIHRLLLFYHTTYHYIGMSFPLLIVLFI